MIRIIKPSLVKTLQTPTSPQSLTIFGNLLHAHYNINIKTEDAPHYIHVYVFGVFVSVWNVTGRISFLFFLKNTDKHTCATKNRAASWHVYSTGIYIP